MTVLSVLRNELKYYISMSEYCVLRSILLKSMKRDAYSQNGAYKVISLYFDDVYDNAYYEKIDGVELRKKIRIRVYDINYDVAKLEIKNKLNNRIFKETLSISKDEINSILNQEYSFLLKRKEKLAYKLYTYFKSEHFLPKVVVAYEREAFMCPYNKIRVTLDKHLEVKSNSKKIRIDYDKIVSMKEGTVILEVKYNNFLPQWIKLILSKIKTKKSAISKYCMSREGDLL